MVQIDTLSYIGPLWIMGLGVTGLILRSLSKSFGDWNRRRKGQ